MGNGIYFKIAGYEDLDMLQIFAIKLNLYLLLVFEIQDEKYYYFIFKLMKKGQELQDR